MSSKKIDITKWIDLLEGDCRVDLPVPGYGTYGPWGFRDRTIDWHVFHFVTRGGVRAEWDGGNAVVGTGDAFWLSPGVRHSFSLADPGRRVSLFHLRVGVSTPQHAVCRTAVNGLVMTRAEAVRPLFEAIHANEHRVTPHTPARRRSLAILLCSAFLDRIEDPAAAGRRLTDAQQREIEALVRGPGAFVTPVQLANTVDLSPEYFARLFVATYRQKPRTWLMHQRIRSAAAALLESAATVAEVAQRYGYGDPYLFSRQFKQVMGVGPQAFRRDTHWKSGPTLVRDGF